MVVHQSVHVKKQGVDAIKHSYPVLFFAVATAQTAVIIPRQRMSTMMKRTETMSQRTLNVDVL